MYTVLGNSPIDLSAVLLLYNTVDSAQTLSVYTEKNVLLEPFSFQVVHTINSLFFSLMAIIMNHK